MKILIYCGIEFILDIIDDDSAVAPRITIFSKKAIAAFGKTREKAVAADR